jgi:hypothetical protein
MNHKRFVYVKMVVALTREIAKAKNKIRHSLGRRKGLTRHFDNGREPWHDKCTLLGPPIHLSKKKRSHIYPALSAICTPYNLDCVITGTMDYKFKQSPIPLNSPSLTEYAGDQGRILAFSPLPKYDWLKRHRTQRSPPILYSFVTLETGGLQRSHFQ